ncbi:MAG TPA: PD-(D/E)XK nuclease family protein, partial [Nannocystaceae bacterium]|nr:PD-(D/E)XK nuclease family protein [Nannocystaceae bacterium]
LWIANEDGFFGAFVPEIAALAMEQDPVHRHKDVLTHTFMVTANTSPRLVVRLAALFHDVGKSRTRRYAKGKVTFHHHEAVGARMTRDRLTALGHEPAMVTDVARLVELSGRFHGYQHGWEDSAVRRYARDAFLLEAIRRSRERTTLVAGRASADGEPLIPSRLLLAGERDQLPARIIRLCDHEKARRWALPRGAPPAGSVSRFRVPPPGEAPSVASMSVTEFGWYLRCPYRYWLKYVKKLRVVEDGGVELDALQFGNITHEVLQGFGEDASIAVSTDADQIRDYLDDALDRAAYKLFGRRPLPAIRIQLARLRSRLHAFSRHQARHRAEGWRIDRCEFELPAETFLQVPGQEPMQIKGKIDRIDRNERDGSWMIIDYKTSESGKRPEITHKATGRNAARGWDDLQLPLYHHLAAQHGVDGRVQLAYMNLPKKPEDAAIHVARWSQAELDDGIEVAREIVRKIRGGHFEMTDTYPGHFEDDFANICQTRVFGGGDELEAEG